MISDVLSRDIRGVDPRVHFVELLVSASIPAEEIEQVFRLLALYDAKTGHALAQLAQNVLELPMTLGDPYLEAGNPLHFGGVGALGLVGLLGQGELKGIGSGGLRPQRGLKGFGSGDLLPQRGLKGLGARE